MHRAKEWSLVCGRLTKLIGAGAVLPALRLREHANRVTGRPDNSASDL
jgi:hypothetical protein